MRPIYCGPLQVRSVPVARDASVCDMRNQMRSNEHSERQLPNNQDCDTSTDRRFQVPTTRDGFRREMIGQNTGLRSMDLMSQAAPPHCPNKRVFTLSPVFFRLTRFGSRCTIPASPLNRSVRMQTQGADHHKHARQVPSAVEQREVQPSSSTVASREAMAPPGWLFGVEA